MSVPSAAHSHRPWHELFNRHMNVLREHLTFLDGVTSRNDLQAHSRGAAQRCADDTRDMMTKFEELQTSFDNAPNAMQADSVTPTKRSSSDLIGGHSPADRLSTSHPLKKRRTERSKPRDPVSASTKRPAPDGNDYFTIDTNPTPEDRLVSQRKEDEKGGDRKKRKLSGNGMHALGAPEPERLPGQAKVQPKRPRKNDTKPLISNGIHLQETQDTYDEEEASFMAKVQRRHEEQEAKRQEKASKKRKRASNGSLDGQASVEPNTSKPGKKKFKQDNRVEPQASAPTLKRSVDTADIGRKKS